MSEMAGKFMATKPTSSPIPSSSSIKHICPRYEHAAQLLGKRWTGLLLSTLLDGPKRFGEMTALVEGLSDRVLSDRLRELEAEGIIKREVYPQIPVRVEYQLTDKGCDLRPIIEAIHTWADEWVVLPSTCPTGEIACQEQEQ